MNARVERAEAEVVRIQRTVDEAQQQTRILQANNAVLFAPDTLRVDLAGEGPAPGSTARAFMSRHSGLVFAANQLPALPADKVYQLWVVPQGDAPVPISAGLLAPDAERPRLAVLPDAGQRAAGGRTWPSPSNRPAACPRRPAPACCSAPCRWRRPARAVPGPARTIHPPGAPRRRAS